MGGVSAQQPVEPPRYDGAVIKVYMARLTAMIEDVAVEERIPFFIVVRKSAQLDRLQLHLLIGFDLSRLGRGVVVFRGSEVGLVKTVLGKVVPVRRRRPGLVPVRTRENGVQFLRRILVAVFHRIAGDGVLHKAYPVFADGEGNGVDPLFVGMRIRLER